MHARKADTRHVLQELVRARTQLSVGNPCKMESMIYILQERIDYHGRSEDYGPDGVWQSTNYHDIQLLRSLIPLNSTLHNMYPVQHGQTVRLPTQGLR